MHQATMANLTGGSNKPQITGRVQPSDNSSPASLQDDSTAAPDAQARKNAGCISDKQERRLYAILSKSGVSQDDFNLYVRVMLKHDHLYGIKVGTEYDKLCGYLENDPAVFTNWAKKYRDENSKKAEVPAEVTQPELDVKSICANIRALALQAGYDKDEGYAAILNSRFKIENPDDLLECDEKTLSRIADYFLSESEQK
jgi:hypothetical protein